LKRSPNIATGAVIRQVQCERCRTEYFYELARVAKGTGSARLWSGQRSGPQARKKSAEKKLARMLLNDGEAVPMPQVQIGFKAAWCASPRLSPPMDAAARNTWCGGVSYF